METSTTTSQSCARIRLERELRDFMANPPTNISFGLTTDDDLFSWQGIIIGPVDTPIEGAIFQLSLKFPTDYPFNPPKVNFETKVYHPNIDVSRGTVDINILGDQWSSALTTEKLMLSICSILLDPIVEDVDGGNPISEPYLPHDRNNCCNKAARRFMTKQLFSFWSKIKLLILIRDHSYSSKPGRR